MQHQETIKYERAEIIRVAFNKEIALQYVIIAYKL